eukprot:PhM_4_TR17752/c0_g1_i1/m.54912
MSSTDADAASGAVPAAPSLPTPPSMSVLSRSSAGSHHSPSPTPYVGVAPTTSAATNITLSDGVGVSDGNQSEIHPLTPPGPASSHSTGSGSVGVKVGGNLWPTRGDATTRSTASSPRSLTSKWWRSALFKRRVLLVSRWICSVYVVAVTPIRLVAWDDVSWHASPVDSLACLIFVLCAIMHWRLDSRGGWWWRDLLAAIPILAVLSGVGSALPSDYRAFVLLNVFAVIPIFLDLESAFVETSHVVLRHVLAPAMRVFLRCRCDCALGRLFVSAGSRYGPGHVW